MKTTYCNDNLMGIVKIIIVFLTVYTANIPYQSYAQSQRLNLNFDADWQFHKGDIAIKKAVKAGRQGGLTDANVKLITGDEEIIAYTDKNKIVPYKPTDWQNINLPHDWLVDEPVVNDNTIGSQRASNGYHPGGIGLYRKEFSVAETDKSKKITIEFDGIFRNSTVWVNGHLMGNHQSGYIPVNYDLTDVLRYGTEGKNVILVKVDATDYEGWWYEGAGIYRHTWLTKTDRVHVTRFGTFVTTPQLSASEARVNIKTTIQNENSTSKSITLISKILDSKGTVLDVQTATQTVAPYDQQVVAQNGLIKHPSLWSPEAPTLYKLHTEVKERDNLLDTYETTFGVRTVELTNQGFFLNGKLYPIKGTANHQDFAGVGVALPDKINEYKIKLLKEMGCNGYRSAHNAPNPELLHICDSLGMLVLDENRLLSSTEEGIKDLTTLVLRDRNHPSVMMWNLENEENLEGNVTGTRILQTLAATVHKLDPTRQVTAAMNHGWNEGGYSDVLDVVGYNYGQRGMQYVKDHEKFPNRKMLVTESTSYVSTRGEYEDNKEKAYVSNLGKGVGWGLQPGQDWKHIVLYPYLSGTFAWTGFDYRGEPTPYLWPNISSHFGIMDLCGFPKDGYYAYKAAWTTVPTVHIFPHWNWPGKEGKTIKLRGYTNCDEVEVFVNGKTLGKKKIEPFDYFEYDAIYQPGRLEVKGFKQNKLITKEVIETTNKPSLLALVSDTQTLKANGTDVAIVNIAVKDNKGRVVPTADNLVKFSIAGPGRIIGVGNGDPSSHDPEKSNQRKAFNGYCQVLIQTNKSPGKILLKATSANLRDAEVILQAY
ncbi:beta-galactosidase GalA [Mucilaginibacter terrae]|uniref:beta-galactosidase GalA n=1 Tax=Mucilaginibacter terrae TaxID=1955052 RepID=UPI0036453248